jgi:hypothetical protein
MNTTRNSAAVVDLLAELADDATRLRAAAHADDADLLLVAAALAEFATRATSETFQVRAHRFAELLYHMRTPHAAVQLIRLVAKLDLPTHVVFALTRLDRGIPVSSYEVGYPDVVVSCVTNPVWQAALEEAIRWDVTERFRGWKPQAGDRAHLVEVLPAIARTDVLTACMRYPDGKLAAAAALRFVEVASAEEVDVLFHQRIVFHDAGNRALIDAMTPDAVRKLAVEPNLSYLLRDYAAMHLTRVELEAELQQPHPQNVITSLTQALEKL